MQSNNPMDLHFAIRRVVDVAVRLLFPDINDRHTAITAAVSADSSTAPAEASQWRVTPPAYPRSQPRTNRPGRKIAGRRIHPAHW